MFASGFNKLSVGFKALQWAVSCQGHSVLFGDRRGLVRCYFCSQLSVPWNITNHRLLMKLKTTGADSNSIQYKEGGAGSGQSHNDVAPHFTVYCVQLHHTYMDYISLLVVLLLIHTKTKPISQPNPTICISSLFSCLVFPFFTICSKPILKREWGYFVGQIISSLSVIFPL